MVVVVPVTGEKQTIRPLNKTMQTLLDIAKVVTAKVNGRRLSDTVIPDGTDSIFSNYLKKILNQEYRSDAQAAEDIYGTDHNDQRYRTLKSRAFDRLLQGLLLLEIRRPAHSEYQVSYHRCARNVVAARLLISFASRKIGTRIAEKALIVAKRYQFTELTLDLLTLLRDSYSIFLEKRSYQECNEQVKHYLALLKAELRSDALLDHLQIVTRTIKSIDDAILTSAQAWFEEHSKIAAAHASHKIVLNQFRFSVVYHGLIKDVHIVNEACDAARSYLSRNPHITHPSRVGAFGLLKIRACLLSRQSQLILSELDDVVSSFTEGSTEWFVALEYGVLASLQAAEYQRAFNLWAKGHRSRGMVHTFPHIQESWHLLEAYMHLMMQLGLIGSAEQSSETFRVSTFLNSVPEFSKEKDGYNTHILIAHVFFLILSNEFEAADRRIEHLRVYASRYLKSPNDQSLRLFVKLLTGLSRASYRPDRVSVTNAQLAEQLDSSLPQYALGGPNEIVPLSVLYRQLVAVLSQRT